MAFLVDHLYNTPILAPINNIQQIAEHKKLPLDVHIRHADFVEILYFVIVSVVHVLKCMRPVEKSNSFMHQKIRG